jgi:hypothetical protein
MLLVQDDPSIFSSRARLSEGGKRERRSERGREEVKEGREEVK